MCQKIGLLFLSIIFIQSIYSQSDKTIIVKGNTIQNICKEGRCLNFNTIGNFNTTSVIISIDKINDFLNRFEQRFSKIAKAQEDRVFKKFKAFINEVRTNATASGLVNSQFKSTELSDTLADKYLMNDKNYGDIKKEIFKNYITIKPLSCNLNKIRITEIDNEKFYLAENINLTYDDITLSETKNSNIIPFKFKNKYGFINKDGEIIVSPQYDSVIASDREYIWVYKTNLYWGFVDSLGELRKKYLSDEYETVHPFYSSRALVKSRVSNNGNCYSFINKLWKLVAGPYKYAYDFSYGKACVANVRPDSCLINYFDLDTLDQNGLSICEYIHSTEMYDPPLADSRMKIFTAFRSFRDNLWTKNKMILALKEPVYFLSKVNKKLRSPKNLDSCSYVEIIKAIADVEGGVPYYYPEAHKLKIAVDSIWQKVSGHFSNLDKSIQATYIDTTGKCITDYYPVALPFDYPNLARVGSMEVDKLANKFRISYYLIDQNGTPKGSFYARRLYNSSRYYAFPISNFKERWATCENLIVDSAGEVSHKLEEGITFSGQFDNGIFIIKKVIANPGVLYKEEKYGLINQDGLEILPPLFRNIAIINSFLAKAENFERKILYYNITSKGMIKLLK